MLSEDQAIPTAGERADEWRDPFREATADDPRWEALLRRDAGADGTFVYCRTSCAARMPLRVNVAFHATLESAEAAGFRPCLRCRPNEASLAERQAAAIAAACRLIDEAETVPDLKTLSAAAGLSPHYFHRVFKRTTGVIPRAYAAARRAERVAARLPRGRLRHGGDL